MASLPLEGVRIVDLTVVWAGPFGAMQLADLGAEVILVESLQYNFAGRRGRMVYPTQQFLERSRGSYLYADGIGGPRAFNRYYGNWRFRNRLSMTVDLTRPEGQEVIKRLVKVSDGLIENQAARNMEQFGLDYPDLVKVNPELIMVRMPGFGITGPYKNRLAYGFTMDAIAGHTSLRHYPDDDPITVGVFHGDACGGGILAGAFLTALHHRDRTGKGQLIDISQTELMATTLGHAFMDYLMNGRVQGSLGNRDNSMAPQGVYPCKDNEPPLPDDRSWFVLSVETDEQWQALCRVMGRPELADDPRFADAISRKKNEDLTDPIIIDWAQDKTQYQIMYLLQAEGIPAGPVLHEREVYSDPHLAAREHLVPITHPETGPYVNDKPTPGTHRHAGPVYKLSETPCRMERAPLLGEHNEYVYKELLGYSQAEYDRLVAEKHIGDAYLPNAR